MSEMRLHKDRLSWKRGKPNVETVINLKLTIHTMSKNLERPLNSWEHTVEPLSSSESSWEPGQKAVAIEYPQNAGEVHAMSF